MSEMLHRPNAAVLQMAPHKTVLVLDHDGIPMGDSGLRCGWCNHIETARAGRRFPMEVFWVVVDGTLYRAPAIRLREDEISPWPLRPAPRWAIATFRKD